MERHKEHTQTEVKAMEKDMARMKEDHQRELAGLKAEHVAANERVLV